MESESALLLVAFALGVIGVLGALGGVLVRGPVIGWLIRRRLDAAERAALAASVHDEGFDPAAVIAAARRHFAPLKRPRRAYRRRAIEERFGRGSVDSLLDLGGERPDLDPARIRLQVRRPEFRFAELELDAAGRVARVTIRAAAEVEARHEDGDLTHPWPLRVSAFWTFGRPRNGHWWLVGIEPGESGEHRLDSDPTGERALLARLRDESVRELTDPPGEVEIPHEIATSLPSDVDAAMRDLMLIDDRFTPEAIEVSLRDMVRRWEEACEGSRKPLEEVAAPKAVSSLLRGDRVVRGASLEKLHVTRVWAARVPPELGVELVVRAWHGTKGEVRGRERRRRHWWRLAATTSRRLPWRLVKVSPHPFGTRRRRLSVWTRAARALNVER
jgi:hypothetical protein